MAKRSDRPSRARRKAAAPPVAAAGTAFAGIRYIESSALVATLLEHDAEALTSLRARARQVTSALTLADTARAIVRARIGERLTPDAERAAVRLDAVHIATVESLGEPPQLVSVVTRDQRVRENARALGYAVD